MLVLTDGILLFLIAFFIHLFIWKIHLPKNHTKVLLIIFGWVFLVGIWFLSYLNPLGPFGYAQLGVLFFSMMLAYLTTYSGIEVESTSLRMMLDIAGAGSKGLASQALAEAFSDDSLVGLRLKDLVKDRMIILDGQKYRLAPKGAVLVRLFIGYRKLLNAGKGG
jgi:hypothetical protein